MDDAVTSDKWVVLPGGSDVFDAELRAGALKHAAACGFHNIRFAGESDLLSVVRELLSVAGRRVGVIGHVRTAQLMREVQALGAFCVLMGEDELALWRQSVATPVMTCAVDHRAVGAMAASYLHAKRRFRSFAFVDAPQKVRWRWWTELRHAGFVAGLRASGFADAARRLSVANGDGADRSAEILAELGAMPRPAALFCCNDKVAYEVAMLCRRGCLAVPSEFAILGVDNELSICEHAPVEISSIALDRRSLGARVMARLFRVLEEGRPDDGMLRTLPVQVWERDSTRNVEPEDLCALRALRLIDGQATVRLSMTRIVAASGVSRSCLERHFRKVTGRSVHDYLEDAVLSTVVVKLRETELTETRIAEDAGYSSVSYLCVKFRRRFGMTMQAYRESCRRDGSSDGRR